MRAPTALAVAAAVTLLLAGCFGPGPDELLARADSDFDALVSQASAVDLAVLHTLEVDEPRVEACGTDSEDEHTVLVASGTMAVQTDASDGRALVDAFEPAARPKDEPWREITKGVSGVQRAWVDHDGITASVTVEDGLLVVAVFTPCR